ncbi:phosphopentomutase [Sporomusaceae bacterium BoRhaA]|uniref:phosphopentomutase n=1 Tax=Pelorhabdus rhamnosifermentans TaxID=2772457 RepID=UPI001C05F1F4|nr:phosphopentomutase [Pelorhabdus rhamnosifermentans]MBU2700988.1 phosphopentomutase [Pelorhabdus rhamnosifermentans]
MFHRIILIVLDSVGIGALPDAADFGDENVHTLGHIARSQGGLILPSLESLGLGCIESLCGVSCPLEPRGCYGKLAEISRGKDTTSGHWEMAGCPVFIAFPVYPKGFPPDIVAAFEQLTGYKMLGNQVASGTEIIAEFGEVHMRTGQPIVYTSADSVLQIAAHEETFGLDELYRICKITRKEICIGDHQVGRIIARPFIGTPGNFVRTPNRHDYSIFPPAPTVLDLLKKQEFSVLGVGKIGDIFAQRGLTQSVSTQSNHDGMQRLSALMKTEIQQGLIMANLVEFDSQYGHRRNPAGYKAALEEFDQDLAVLIRQLDSNDLLIITADHGCDPTATGSDHTREYVPLIVYAEGLESHNLGVRSTFADIGATIAENFLPESDLPYGTSFLQQLVKDKSGNF